MILKLAELQMIIRDVHRTAKPGTEWKVFQEAFAKYAEEMHSDRCVLTSHIDHQTHMGPCSAFAPRRCVRNPLVWEVHAEHDGPCGGLPGLQILKAQ